jgi:hypothetical protein
MVTLGKSSAEAAALPKPETTTATRPTAPAPDKCSTDRYVVCPDNHSTADYRGSNVCRNRRWPLCYDNKGGLWTHHEKIRTCLRCTCSTLMAPLHHYIVTSQNRAHYQVYTGRPKRRKARDFFATLVPFCQTTWRHIPEDNNLQLWYYIPLYIYGSHDTWKYYLLCWKTMKT